MYCPSCLTPTEPRHERCPRCQASLSGLRDRIAVGSQFLFVEASERRPVALSVDSAKPTVFTQPELFSRHRHAVGLGDHRPSPPIRRRPPQPPEMDVPRLPPPAGPNLTAVITERKIYRPREEARILILAPGAAGQSVEMEVQLAGQQITREQLTLNEAGLLLRPFADLEEGEYTVLVRRAAAGADGLAETGAVRCSFSVAEFALSPLTALLEQHTYERGTLSFRLRLVALSVPYHGRVELGLQCAEAGERIVASRGAQVREGILESSFDVAQHSGPFRVQIAAPGGETATVFFPGTARAERERITLCPLGQVAEAGLLPGDATQEVRGLHVGYTDAENTPLRLESAIARTGCLIADVTAAVVQVITFHPGTGATTLHEFRNVHPGDRLDFPVEAPYTLFTVGMLAPRQAYEAWGAVVRPADLAGQLSAPLQAAPGDTIAVRVEADRPAACLLLVYDARLEHESPVPKLGKQLRDAIQTASGDLRERTVPSLSSAGIWPFQQIYAERTWRSATAVGRVPPQAIAPVLLSLREYLAADVQPALAGAQPPAALEAEAQPLTFVAAPSREEFPELAHLEQFTVDGAAERAVALGDQIGTWRCRAYLVAGLDLLELTADVRADKEVYAELDVPAIVGRGDDILASIRYHTAQPAVLTLALPGGEGFTGAVLGHGLQTFHLTQPGEVAVHLSSAGGEDWSRRTIPPPGAQSVTVSRLELLKRGETVSAERVVVYPGPGDVLAETIAALGRYPFG